MYGLLLQSISEYLRNTLGDGKWDEIRQRAGVRHHSFVTHKTYSETIIPRICQATIEMTGVSRDDLMESFGTSFVQYVGGYSYDRLLKVLGRNLRDFLNGLDNLHEYLRFTYPKMKSPSFIVEKESRHGIVIRYRSRRKGFQTYVRGQIRHIGAIIYQQDIKIETVKEEISKERVDVVMKLVFNNTAYDAGNLQEQAEQVERALPIRSSLFFSMFPFHIVFNRMLSIQHAGGGLQCALAGDIVGQSIDEVFSIVRPFIDFSWENILGHTNNIFELASIHPVGHNENDIEEEDDYGANAMKLRYRFKDDLGDSGSVHSASRSSRTGRSDTEMSDILHLKGQMMHMSDWNSIIFLGTPVLQDLDAMMNVGLYINDLSMHDSSRDLVLAGTQQSAELKMALDQEQQKSKKLEESMKKLDMEMSRTDELLYQMIPKQVADRLRSGEPSVNTCEVFSNVTILFSDVVGFTTICSKITPMEVVSMLNAMYTKFDQLIELHRVYKVETIGDAYMVVGGAPTVTKYHATLICDMALDMCDVITEIKDPASSECLNCRVGIHSGPCVAGVVGTKMPRYCLFGDTVNTASRMESNGEALKIHISQSTKDQLQGVQKYKVEERGKMEIKGKGDMKTYWLYRAEGSQNFLNTQAYIQMLEKEEATSNEVRDVDGRPRYSSVTADDVRKSLTNFPSSTSLSRKNTDNPSPLGRGSPYTPVMLNTKHDRQSNLDYFPVSKTPVTPIDTQTKTDSNETGTKKKQNQTTRSLPNADFSDNNKTVMNDFSASQKAASQNSHFREEEGNNLNDSKSNYFTNANNANKCPAERKTEKEQVTVAENTTANPAARVNPRKHDVKKRPKSRMCVVA